MNINKTFDKNMYNTVAKNIKKYRELKNLTLSEFSNYTQISEDYLLKLEKFNNTTISIYDLYKISKVLDISIDKFFQKEE